MTCQAHNLWVIVFRFESTALFVLIFINMNRMPPVVCIMIEINTQCISLRSPENQDQEDISVSGSLISISLYLHC